MTTQTTSTRGSIVRPSSPITGVSSTPKIDYIKVIESILALDPSNRINANSLLYKLSLKQWFSQVKGSKIRKTLPSFFCGFPGPPSYFRDVEGQPYFLKSTQFGIISPDDVEAPTLEPSSYFFEKIAPSSLNYILCAEDLCLDFGLPGSFGYASCSANIVELETTIDWSNAFYSVLSAVELSAMEIASEGGLDGDADMEFGPGSDTGDLEGVTLKVYLNTNTLVTSQGWVTYDNHILTCEVGDGPAYPKAAIYNIVGSGEKRGFKDDGNINSISITLPSDCNINIIAVFYKS